MSKTIRNIIGQVLEIKTTDGVTSNVYVYDIFSLGNDCFLEAQTYFKDNEVQSVCLGKFNINISTIKEFRVLEVELK